MKTVSKRLFSVLLAVILLVSAVPFQASADGYKVTFQITDPVQPGNSKSQVVSDKPADQPYGTLPTMADFNYTVPEGWQFVRWTVTDTSGPEFTSATTVTEDMTVCARFEPIFYAVRYYYTKDNGANFAEALPATSKTYNDVKDVSLLNFLGAKKNDMQAFADTIPGYEWESGKLWYDHTSKAQLTEQPMTMKADRAVFIKLVPNTYKLTFNPNGGAVSPTEKDVTFDAAVGALPIPTRANYVFKGWFTNSDGTGTEYKADTKYEVPGNTTLYAKWEPEAEIRVRVYVNDDVTTPKLVNKIFGKAAGDSVSQTEVKAIIDEFYHGYTAYGLYLESAFNQHVAGGDPTGQQTVTVPTGTSATNPFQIYVHIKNAQSGSVASSTTAPATTAPATSATTATTATTSGKADKTNPKTGDSVMIEAAVGIMVLAGAAFITMEQLRKHKKI